MYLVVGYIFIIPIRKGKTKEVFHNFNSALFYAKNLKDFVLSGNNQRPVLLSQDRSNFSGRSEVSSLPPQQREVLFNDTGACLNQPETFSLILPNLIHKSRRKNLKS